MIPMTNLITLSDAEFQVLSEYINNELGIMMPPVKKTLIESRLQKRLRILGMSSFKEYSNYVFNSTGGSEEIIHFLDVVTTNKTDFFREAGHFDFLVRTALPELERSKNAGTRKKLMIWSAGCSTGEEPYTIAMVLDKYANDNNYNNFDYLIIGTDISTRVLSIAKKGIYREELIAPVSAEYRHKYLLKSRDRKSGLVRISPALRERIAFRRLNFMDGDFGFREPFDMIFCRNVMIYFDKETRESLLNKFCRYLEPGGYLFIGHSETMQGIGLPIKKAANSVYRRI